MCPIARSLLCATVALAGAVSAGATNVSPVLSKFWPTVVLTRGGAGQTLTLTDYFTDPDVPGTAVRLSVRIGTEMKTIDLAMYDAQTPVTVANFLAYLDAGYYSANMVHRSVPGFIIQSGGYRFLSDTMFGYVPQFSPIVNEYGISNTRGTVAMAKISGDPDSATNQWFINLADNSANLDTQNGGFTVFARVVGTGMDVADEIAALTRYDLTGNGYPWNEIPLTTPAITRAAIVETSAARVPTLSFAATSAAPGRVAVSLDGAALTLTPGPDTAGDTTIAITATDLDGATLTQNLSVRVRDSYATWRSEVSLPSDSQGDAAADYDGDGVPNLLEFAFGGDAKVAAAIPGVPVSGADGRLSFVVRRYAALRYVAQTSTDLVNWTTEWASEEGLRAGAVINVTSGTDQDTVTLAPAGSVGEAKRFWRMLVDDNP